MSTNAVVSQPEPEVSTERTAEECIVQLEVADADAVNAEVEAGEHQTFDDALHYIIERGLAEISRQRKTQAKSAAQRQALGALKDMLSKAPDAAGKLDPKLVAAMKAAGIVK